MVINNCLCSQEAKLCFDESSLEKKKNFFMLYHKCKALLAEQVSGRGKTAGEIHGKGISQVPPHFVNPERATGYFTFQVCNSSADPGWICPWNHDPPAPAHSLSEFYLFTPLRVQKNPSIQEEKSCKNLHYSPMHT